MLGHTTCQHYLTKALEPVPIAYAYAPASSWKAAGLCAAKLQADAYAAVDGTQSTDCSRFCCLRSGLLVVCGRGIYLAGSVALVESKMTDANVTHSKFVNQTWFAVSQ